MKRTMTTLLALTLAGAGLVALSGCKKEEGPMEKTGAKMDQAAKDAAKKTEEAAKKVDDAMKKP